MVRKTRSTSPMQKEIEEHYAVSYEELRLDSNAGKIEKKRLQEFLQRFLPAPPAAILDVGGGTGVHACWLAKRGYEVHLVDILPVHVELASKASEAQPDTPLATVSVGDACSLKRSDASVDGVLLFGPMYHLTDREDRLTALKEAYRVLKPGGTLMAIGVSRFVYALDGLFRGFLDDPAFVSIVERDLQDGQHRNPTNNRNYFTKSFFHNSEELQTEVREGKFQVLECLGVEGPGWLLQNFKDHWDDDGRRSRMFKIIQALESEPSLLGISAHLMVVARKS